jgi:hypothetical protein
VPIAQRSPRLDQHTPPQPQRESVESRFGIYKRAATAAVTTPSSGPSSGPRIEGLQDLLALLYACFTEGFDTRDLRDAKALLEDLAV